MTKEIFRIAVGSAVLCAHFFCLVIIFFFKDEYISQSGRISIALTLMPITASYVCAVVKSAVDRSEVPASKKKVSANYCIIVTIFTTFTLAGLIFVVWSLEGSQEADKQTILLFETAFGAAFGFIAADLFGTDKPNN